MPTTRTSLETPSTILLNSSEADVPRTTWLGRQVMVLQDAFLSLINRVNAAIAWAISQLFVAQQRSEAPSPADAQLPSEVPPSVTAGPPQGNASCEPQPVSPSNPAVSSIVVGEKPLIFEDAREDLMKEFIMPAAGKAVTASGIKRENILSSSNKSHLKLANLFYSELKKVMPGNPIQKVELIFRLVNNRDQLEVEFKKKILNVLGPSGEASSYGSCGEKFLRDLFGEGMSISLFAHSVRDFLAQNFEDAKLIADFETLSENPGLDSDEKKAAAASKKANSEALKRGVTPSSILEKLSKKEEFLSLQRSIEEALKQEVTLPEKHHLILQILREAAETNQEINPSTLEENFLIRFCAKGLPGSLFGGVFGKFILDLFKDLSSLPEIETSIEFIAKSENLSSAQKQTIIPGLLDKLAKSYIGAEFVSFSGYEACLQLLERYSGQGYELAENNYSDPLAVCYDSSEEDDDDDVVDTRAQVQIEYRKCQIAHLRYCAAKRGLEEFSASELTFDQMSTNEYIIFLTKIDRLTENIDPSSKFYPGLKDAWEESFNKQILFSVAAIDYHESAELDDLFYEMSLKFDSLTREHLLSLPQAKVLTGLKELLKGELNVVKCTNFFEEANKAIPTIESSDDFYQAIDALLEKFTLKYTQLVTELDRQYNLCDLSKLVPHYNTFVEKFGRPKLSIVPATERDSEIAVFAGSYGVSVEDAKILLDLATEEREQLLVLIRTYGLEIEGAISLARMPPPDRFAIIESMR